jgi:hypothetical protein
MDLLEKKKRAAAIAVAHFVQMEQESKFNGREHPWGRMGINRMVNDREVLFRKGKFVGPKNL